MPDRRALDALHRIEQALARIEAAASRPASAAAPEDFDEYLQLRESHEALRAQVAGAIGEVDRLIATGEQG